MTYISSVRGNITIEECNAILAKSRINNRRLDVSGVLLFNSKRFLQALEGEEHVIKPLFEKISADPRHAAVVMLNHRAIEARQFGSWAMAFDDGSGKADLRERIGRLLADTDPSTRALFETTATLHRPGQSVAR
ncbi:photopigment and puc expression activator [Sphingobium sp. SCG-1]|nr:photopigment and puc expression activator [Sphingobium sp. SCG-1]